MSTRTINGEGQLALFQPASSWTPPRSLPYLTDIDIGLDTETRDDGLAKERGPGWVYHAGYITGVSVAWAGGRIYAPVRHPDTECFQINEVMQWVEHLLRTCRVHFFNIGYDMGWIRAEGCTVWPERAEDGAAMAVMVDENHNSYGLDNCCARVGLPGKDETLLREAAASLGIQPKFGSVKHGIWRLPARYVGPYAEIDAEQTLQLCKSLEPVLRSEGTWDAYRTEMELFPCTNAMRWRGIPVSTEKCEASIVKVRGMRDAALESIAVPWHGRCTIEDLRSPERLARLFDDAGVEYPRTPRRPIKGEKGKANPRMVGGQPSFQAEWLEHLTHPLGGKVRRAKKLEDLAEKFLTTYILGYEHRGRIHAEIRQLKGERGGAVTNRFSYSDPPLQQMVSRDPELAPLVRDCFEPERGMQWLAADYKGQEPRLNVHYAYLSARHARRLGIQMGDIEEVVRYYREDPNPDLHTYGAKILNLTRAKAKDLNQGLTYRMSARLLATHLNIPEEDAADLWNRYHSGLPYISGIAKFCEARAKSHGFIRMIDGARRHYSLWQPKGEREEKGYAHLTEAEKKWPSQPLERAFTYQAGNSLIQGSAARQMKRGMVAMYREGFLPIVSMHDECGANVESAAQVERIGELLISAVRLVIPVAVDLEVGPTWGKAKTDYRKVFA